MSDLRLPVEVDPWSDGRWSRLEREMFDELDRSDAAAMALERRRAVRRRVLLGAGLAAAAALVVLVFHLAGILRSSDRMRVATTDSASEVTVGESSLVVAPRSLVMVSGDDEHGVDVLLDRGSVTCEVAPRRGRPPFVVDAGDVRVRVVGTRFTVARDGAATSVAVDHGVVEVTASGRVVVMHDGERWPERGTSGAPESAIILAAPPAATTPVPPSAPVPAVMFLQTPAPPTPSLFATPPRPHVAPAPPPRPAAAPSGESQRDANGAADGAPSASEVPTLPPPSAQGAYEAAARIERTRPEDAAAIYRQVIAGETAWTPSAIFALGRLEAERGRRQEATRLLQGYLARYPHGINAEDARSLLQRMQ